MVTTDAHEATDGEIPEARPGWHAVCFPPGGGSDAYRKHQNKVREGYTYSVPSRLIGERVRVWLFEDRFEALET